MAGAERLVTFRLSISADELRRYYGGAARDVLARTIDGRTVRFPARVLRPFVTRDGVSGVFRLRYDDQGRFLDIVRVT
ncbi:MAG: DUF2835 domain-containing protein [Ectothiorhodospiraceae bacterium]|jgi:hypothetical protein